MGKRSVTLIISATLGLLAPSSFADLMVTMYYHGVSDRDPSFDGGVFRAVDASTGGDSLPDIGGPDFRTYCIETNEFIRDGSTYWVEITTEARFGGSGGPNPDPLDPRTAYLYYGYRTNPGALNPYLDQSAGTASFTSSVSAHVQRATRQFQEALWSIEEESGGVANTLVTHAGSAVLDNLLWEHGSDSIGPVRVMQLWKHQSFRSESYRAQDQLTVIPAPDAALLGVIGLGALSHLRRRVG